MTIFLADMSIAGKTLSKEGELLTARHLDAERNLPVLMNIWVAPFKKPSIRDCGNSWSSLREPQVGSELVCFHWFVLCDVPVDTHRHGAQVAAHHRTEDHKSKDALQRSDASEWSWPHADRQDAGFICSG